MARRHQRLERIFKGVASHRRIEILEVLESHPDLSLKQIVQLIGTDYRTGAEHVRKMSLAGLVWKDRRPRMVCHRLSDRGRQILAFARSVR